MQYGQNQAITRHFVKVGRKEYQLLQMQQHLLAKYKSTLVSPTFLLCIYCIGVVAITRNCQRSEILL
jgi:hypothetical protein